MTLPDLQKAWFVRDRARQPIESAVRYPQTRVYRTDPNIGII